MEVQLAKLCKLQEAHLREIPFENTAQHGVHGGLATLELEPTAIKILRHKRGGFCFELNLLFAQFLRQLGYTVTIFRAFVYVDSIRDFRSHSSHAALIAYGGNGSCMFVDVGFGEPALHPLKYGPLHWGIPQETPEGMLSRFVLDSEHGSIILESNRRGDWGPRLRWDLKESLSRPGLNPEDLSQGLASVHISSSPFTKDVIVCKITRQVKTTFSRNRLKITNNRFKPDETVTNRFVSSNGEARKLLEEEFGIPFDRTIGLSCRFEAEKHLWDHMQ